MKYIIKLILICAVTFVGCMYFKVVSTTHGFNVMDTSSDFGSTLNKLGTTNITYWEIPFAKKYYIAYDTKTVNPISAKVEGTHLYVELIDKETFEKGEGWISKLEENSEKVEKRENYFLYVFVIIDLVILFFPTRKKC